MDDLLSRISFLFNYRGISFGALTRIAVLSDYNMLASSEGVSSLDNLFYDGPIIHKVKPLCQGQGSWLSDAPPSLSQIPMPTTQNIQGEASHHSSFNPTRETDQSVSKTGFMETKSTTPPFKTRLFRAPTTSIIGNDEEYISNETMSPTNDTCFISQVSGSRISSQTSHAVAACSPFSDLILTKQNCDGLTINSIHLDPKPAGFKGSLGKGTLRPVSEIPAEFRSVFKNFPYFNYVQSQALNDVFYSCKNFVACAPTGSGKTVLFELAIVRLLIETPQPWENVRAVYIAPIKALCSQQFENWKQKFGPLGLNCKELTGDTEIDDIFEIQDAHLIFTTPEKWDSMTRRWKDNCLVPSVRLFLIDEVRNNV
ncbi:hypothetical protein DNTS_018982 [Danionella cerebrum]|uniref:Helicase ATP-binding domain-containing protein n=1 Tax=Danionella cerebrum TaxID=2873325 RepID=A0A553QPV0_9TELE|nr:hypothetical protein DNTS_018982 [Danionella translucida]TRY91739.1 hypothetical protein DNTS_018982 [Danionella translucida]